MVRPLLVNLSDGSTERYDLSDSFDLERWRVLQRHRMEEIRGLQVQVGRTLYALPLPKGFDFINLDAERVPHRANPDKEIGTRITVFADNISASILVYDSGRPPMVRFSLERLGRPVYLPHSARG